MKAFYIWLTQFCAALRQQPAQTSPDPQIDPVAASIEPISQQPSQPMPTDPDSIAYTWDTPAHNYHNARVICDQVGLSLQPIIPVHLPDGMFLGYFTQKDILCACIYQESGFLLNPRPNQNKLKDGSVWSTDWGIVQINDYYNIGPGKPFASVEEVLTDPDKDVRWMANILKTTGALKPWASYTSGAFAEHLVPSSPMWALATQV